MLVLLQLSFVLYFTLDITLTNPVQSSTFGTNGNGVISNRRFANLSLDRNTDTNSFTRPTGEKWWRVEMEDVTRISAILLYISEYQLKNYFAPLKVETRLSLVDEHAWTVCVDSYTMMAPLSPHVIICDDVTIAKQVKISMIYGKLLGFQEVIILGTNGEF